MVLNDGAGRFVGAWHEAVRGDVRGVRAAAAGIGTMTASPISWSLGSACLRSSRCSVRPVCWSSQLVACRSPSCGRPTSRWATWMGTGSSTWPLQLGSKGRRSGLETVVAGFLEGAPNRVPSHTGRGQAIVPMDVDGDGDLDLVVGFDASSSSRLYRNDGRGHFVDVSFDLPATPLPVLAMVAVDVDADGDLDLIVATALYAPTQLWVNDGFGPVPQSARSAPGRLALSPGRRGVGRRSRRGSRPGAGGASAPSRLWINDGSGRFRAAPSSHLPTRKVITTALGAGDLDGDGDDDLIVGTSGGHDWHYRNDGGRFVEVGTLGSRPGVDRGLGAQRLGSRRRDLDLVLLAPGLTRVFRNRRQDLVPTRLARLGRRFSLRAFGRPNGGRPADCIIFAGMTAAQPLRTPLGWLRLVPSLTVPLGVAQLSGSTGVGRPLSFAADRPSPDWSGGRDPVLASCARPQPGRLDQWASDRGAWTMSALGWMLWPCLQPLDHFDAPGESR